MTALSSYSTRTLMGLAQQLRGGVTPSTYTFPLAKTINQKRSILANTLPQDIPKIQYVGVGVKGFRHLTDGVLSVPYIPKATNCDLYEPIPFRCRLLADDLTTLERQSYRMRTVQTINGQQYALYWLKVLDTSASTISMIQIDDQNQEVTLDPDVLDLNPVPPTTTVDQVIDSNTNRVSVRLGASVTVTNAEIIEYLNVIHPAPESATLYAMISELGLYCGEDLADGGGTGVPEAVGVQLALHKCWLGSDLSQATASLTVAPLLEFGSSMLL